VSIRQFAQHITVKPEDIDELGHVNNAVYLQYAEGCGRAHADALGLTMARFRELGAVPVVRRHEVNYRRPAHAGDALRVTTEVTRLGGPRAQRLNRILRADTGELLVTVLTDWVWLNPITHRPVRAPEVVVATFGGAFSNLDGDPASDIRLA
jgi:acyl-CoA thioester hydrolase